MRSNDQKRDIQRRIDELTALLNELQTDLNNITDSDNTTTSNRGSEPHQFDQNGDAIYIGDIVLFRPPGTQTGSTIRVRGIVVRFTAQRVYIRREDDTRRKPQEILRDPSHTRLVQFPTR